MSEKRVKTRIVSKHDIAENWDRAQNFVPKQGEIIVYDDRTLVTGDDGKPVTNEIKADYVRYKIGDGVTNVKNLPFVAPIYQGKAEGSTVLGIDTVALGEAAHAEGYHAKATGYGSHAEGRYTTASGQGAHAEGTGSTAMGEYSHAEGERTLSGMRGFEIQSVTDITSSYETEEARLGYSYVYSFNVVIDDDSVTKLQKDKLISFSRAVSVDGGWKPGIDNGLILDTPVSTATGVYTFIIASNDVWDDSTRESRLTNKLYDRLQPELGPHIVSSRAHAEGLDTIATGDAAHVEGRGSKAHGDYAHAEGYETNASGEAAHAEGKDVLAAGAYSHVEGMNCRTYGHRSHAEGHGTTAGIEDQAENTSAAHAEGIDTTASGKSSHAEGKDTTASGEASHAEGAGTSASGHYAHAEGNQTIAEGSCAHAEGTYTTASTRNAHAEGARTTASGYNGSHAEGFGCLASGASSHAEGDSTKATRSCSHAEGSGTTASGYIAHAEGLGTLAKGDHSHSEGQGTKAYGVSSHAENDHTQANGWASHSEGSYSYAHGPVSHAEGRGTKAGIEDNVTAGEGAHAEGRYTTASGQAAHAEGNSTVASGAHSHTEGTDSKATAARAHAEGFGTIAGIDSQHVQGKFNKEDDTAAHIVGWGTSDSDRKNIHTLSTAGDAWFAGKVSVGPLNKTLAYQDDVERFNGTVTAHDWAGDDWATEDSRFIDRGHEWNTFKVGKTKNAAGYEISTITLGSAGPIDKVYADVYEITRGDYGSGDIVNKEYIGNTPVDLIYKANQMQPSVVIAPAGIYEADMPSSQEQPTAAIPSPYVTYVETEIPDACVKPRYCTPGNKLLTRDEVEASYVAGLQKSNKTLLSVGSTSQPVYFNNGVPEAVTNINANKINGKTSTDIFESDKITCKKATKASTIKAVDGSNTESSLSIKILTQAQYDALTTKSNTVLYLIV